MDEESKQSVGIFVFLIFVLVGHVACWIASAVKAVIDRKARRRKAKASKDGALLAEARPKELEDEEEQSNVEPTKVGNGGPKFAISRPQLNSTSTGRANGEHHFPKCPKRLLSAGNAKRVSPEELAIMLDSYAIQKPEVQQVDSAARSPARPTAKGMPTSNVGTVNV
ncbi:unnamed protein product [Hydatigera taeniaeformis]|uniref:Uncharacterized protein n=1 Tax=Hydatigena taeniaeformis TaxID=6205 RepID=A0A0R3WKA4_HYDTA|nr:unnamed protein product [Hydatigera taeniaeformis]